jgi:hypothetical protein
VLRCGWLLALLSFGAVAHGQGLHWGVTVGFGGAYKESAWAPVFVDISNQGDSQGTLASQTGEISIPIVQMGRGGPQATLARGPSITYTAPVEVPRNSKKRYLLYLPPERVEKIYLRLGRTQYAQELSGAKVADRADKLIVVLGGDGGLLNFLEGAQAAPPATVMVKPEDYGGPGGAQQSGPAIRIGRAEWDSLPDSWLGWEGVDAVVLGDSGFGGASPEAVDALVRWVELGGTLIVPGGALAPGMAASPIGQMLPVNVQGTVAAPGLEALAAWASAAGGIEPGPVLLASGPMAKGASVLCGSQEGAGGALIVLRTVGAGRVAMAAFDYTSAPVKYWDGQTAMWQRLIAQAPAPPSLTEGGEQTMPYSREISLSDAATYTPAAALPPFWLLLGFLGAYIIVLVPVNYAVLKRWDRRELAWVTTPAIVIIITLGAYAVGYGMRGGEIILNRLAVIEAAPGAGLARGRGYVGLFSPGRASYQLLLKGTAASARSLSNEVAPTRGAATVIYGPEPKVADIGMNMWTSRAFCVEFLADLKGGVDGVVEYDGKDVRIQVENKTGYTLKRCRLVQGAGQGKKQDIRPGGRAEWAAGRLGAIGDRDRFSGGGPTQLDIAEGMEDLAIRSLFGARSSGRGGPISITSREPCLVAVIDQPVVPVELGGRKPQTNDLNILVARLPVRLASGRRIKVPKWMVAGRPIAADGTIGGGDPWDPALTIYQGSVIFEFRVPLGEKGGTARSLTLTATAGALAGVSVSALNTRLNAWEQLPATLPSVSFPNAADYMSRDGRVLVKIAAHADNVELSEVGIAGVVDTF